jgi:hypothetical protein
MGFWEGILWSAVRHLTDCFRFFSPGLPGRVFRNQFDEEVLTHLGRGSKPPARKRQRSAVLWTVSIAEREAYRLWE